MAGDKKQSVNGEHTALLEKNTARKAYEGSDVEASR